MDLEGRLKCFQVSEVQILLGTKRGVSGIGDTTTSYDKNSYNHRNATTAASDWLDDNRVVVPAQPQHGDK